MRIVMTIVLTVALVAAAAATAQTKITRPIRLIVPYVPGGATDTLSRFLGPFIGEEFGQQVVIDNRGGGSSTIGTQMVARATPDGHTIGMIDAAYLINPSLFAKLPYDSLKDFEPLVLVASSPLVLVVHPGVAATSVKELVALAKAAPGKLVFGSAGNGSAVHLAAEQLRASAGIDLVHVPYKGTGQSFADLIGGQLTMLFTTQSAGKPMVVTGRLRPLAITSPKRTHVMPEVMTFIEAGYPAVDAATINGLLAPAGTPKDYVRRLNAAVVRALKSRAMQDKLMELGFDIVGNTPEEFGVWIRREMVKWDKVVKDAGVRVEGP
jgi:tripartite-type tricarboxylate transporter receptor subunit TctC